MKIYDLSLQPVKEIELPKVFSTKIREDLIRRAVLSIQSSRRQAYGTDKLAGLRTSAHYHGIRKGPHHMMNREMSRLPRTHGSNPSQEMRARKTPHAVSGRAAHPPKSEKVFRQKLNKKEAKLALKSALAASANYEYVSKRHKILKMELPIIFTDEIQSINKTKDLEKLIFNLKFEQELERIKKRKIRSGIGKTRNRKYKNKISFLIVVEKNNGIVKAARNIHGFDIANVKDLNAEILAPGSQPGRLAMFSESAIKKIGELYG